MRDRIKTHRDLIVHQKPFAAGKPFFELSRKFLTEEAYSLTDQVRRPSRSVNANIAEASRKRRYEKHSCSTLNIAEAEAAETQVWIEYAAAHLYLDAGTAKLVTELYDAILRSIVAMIRTDKVKESAEYNAVESDEPRIDQHALLAHHLPTPTSALLPPKAEDR